MKTPYMAFNGLSRRPTVAGVPFMPFVAIGSTGVLGTVMVMSMCGPWGALFTLIPGAMLYFLRELCSTDDRAADMLALELKWIFKGFMANRGRLSGGALAIRPVKYGRRV